MEKYKNYIKLENISKTYSTKEGNNTVLSIDELYIPLDGVVAIIGFSGNGKTTLLNLIGLLDTPDAIFHEYKQNNNKDIYVPIKNNKPKIIYNISSEKKYTITFSQDKHIIKDYRDQPIDINKFRQEIFGFIFQDALLHPSFNVSDNILMPLKIQDKSLSNNYNELLKSFGIEDKYDSNINALSGGQKQRTSVLRGLIKDPDIIFADEPTSNLDYSRSRKILDYAKDKAFIWITHDLLLVEEQAKHIIPINKGRVDKNIAYRNKVDVNGIHEIRDLLGYEEHSDIIIDKEYIENKTDKRFSFNFAKNDFKIPKKNFIIQVSLLTIILFSILSILKINHSTTSVVHAILEDPKINNYILKRNDRRKLSNQISNEDAIRSALNFNMQSKEIEIFPLYNIHSIILNDLNSEGLQCSTFTKDDKIVSSMIENNIITLGDTENSAIPSFQIGDNSFQLGDYISELEKISFIIVSPNTVSEALESLNKIPHKSNIIGLNAGYEFNVNIIQSSVDLPNNVDCMIREELTEILLRTSGEIEGEKSYDKDKKGSGYFILYPDGLDNSFKVLNQLKSGNLIVNDERLSISNLFTIKNVVNLSMGINTSVNILKNSSIVILLFLLILIIYTTVNDSINKKQKEIGVLLSFGITKNLIRKFYFIESTLLWFYLSIYTFLIFIILEPVIEFFSKNDHLNYLLGNNTIDTSLPYTQHLMLYSFTYLVIIFIYQYSINKNIKHNPNKLIRDVP
ncbi:MAG: ABC transporter ATP-binding protein [Campylobacterota bacterium]|nr:ABC transporter ATP-binding protein [Campylobacterota bacterium]